MAYSLFRSLKSLILGVIIFVAMIFFAVFPKLLVIPGVILFFWGTKKIADYFNGVNTKKAD
ncbi:hypothetical protein EI16_00680 [Hydrogenovibrio marinus]|uniref:Uncharacterized protein n=1 Tax=Hydrogenovibrio marinus TaxID=28885 RepID=A0A066ZRG7_HYDMR|nr:hypothetical protein EI16_00680 [Hydrogenovibrio marinus]BBN59325.1 hypothetical protein HVMH_0919 [Hydrogenovibrio marinus]